MRRLAAVPALLVAFALSMAPALAQDAEPAEPTSAELEGADLATTPTLGAAAAILVDLPDGRILYEKNAHDRRAPASTTKIITALVARDRYELDETVVVAPDVLRVTGSKLGVEPGMTFTVRELLYALLLRSGNDVAVALAAHHPLGYDHFIALMNEKARALGAYDSHFENPHGLDEQGHVSSAWDMAIFGRQLLDDPVLAEIVATPSYSVPWPGGSSRSFDNHNKLIRRYDGTVGVKTGFTNRAGRCLVAAADTDSGRVLTVVLGADDHYGDTTKLFDFAAARAFDAVVAAAEQGSSADDDVVLSLPPEPPDVGDEALASAPIGLADYRVAAFTAVLSALMLATIIGPRRHSAWREAAEFHASFDALLDRPASRRP